MFNLWIIVNQKSLPALKGNVDISNRTDRETRGLVSIIVPLRNEVRNIPSLISNLKELTYPFIEFILVDDRSEDNTLAKLRKQVGDDNRFQIISGLPLPDGWVGKPFACHQGAVMATGDYYLFIDADVRLAPHTLEKTLTHFDMDMGLLTGFPRFPLTSFFSHLLVPMQHFIVHFHLPIWGANKTLNQSFSAAHGAFMMFKGEVYHQSGGHETVKNSLVEDIHLAREVKRKRRFVKLMNITDLVTCHMYETNREVWNGFSKNIFPGLGKHVLLAIFLALFYVTFFIFPIILVGISINQSSFLFILPYLLITMMKWSIDRNTNQKWWLCFLFPFSVLLTLIVLGYSTYLGLSNKGFSWKGRTYQ
nr:glycosyltransferase family 2 protein [Evansella tamaricis]